MSSSLQPAKGAGPGEVVRGQLGVVEPGERLELPGEDVVVESGIEFTGPLEQALFAVSLRERENVREVTGLGAVEQGQQFAAGEFLGRKGR